MNTVDDGGPAFPNIAADMEPRDRWRFTPGLTQRDWFAGKFAAALIVNATIPEQQRQAAADEVAAFSYLLADAMLAERAKR